MKYFINTIQNRPYLIILIAIILAHICNMFIDVLGGDAATYAGMSLEMFHTHNFLHIFQRGEDYLDKPPLIFWSASLSFFLFGVSNFTFKLFPVISLGIGIWATYRYARLWYNKQTSFFAAVILLSCQAYFLMTNDVRTDGLLTGWVICSVWLLSEYSQKEKIKYLILGAVTTALALLAKGPIAIITIGIAITSNLLIRKQFSKIFDFKWILYFIVIIVLLLPMFYGLYTQFDLHPEKTVYGLHGPSGVKFFLWTQSFGRITGGLYWNNGAPLYYFCQTMLWDFQPWMLFFIFAIVYYAREFIKTKFKKQILPEYTSLITFISVFMMLSMSKYKLPHYIFIIFPFAAIIVGAYLSAISEKTLKILSGIQFGFIQLFFVAIALMFKFIFPPDNYWLILLCLILLIVVWYSYFKLKNTQRVVIPTLWTVVAFNLVLGLHFYPNLLEYNSGRVAGQWVKQNYNSNLNLYSYDYWSDSFNFYTKKKYQKLEIKNIKDLPSNSLIYTNESGKNFLLLNSSRFKVLKEFKSHSILMLEIPFLNATTRQQTLKNDYLLNYE